MNLLWTAQGGLKKELNSSYIFGFKNKNIIVGQWGNRVALKANFKEWVKYNPLKHTLKNEKDFPLAVWAFAQKS